MKNWYFIIAAVLIGLLIYVLWPRKDVIIDNVKVNELRSKLEKAQAVQQNIIVKAKDDSVKYAIVNKAKDEDIARLKRRAVKAKTPKVDTIIVENPEVGIYIQHLDSVIVSQDSQIAELKEQKAEQWDSFNQLVTASDSTAQANKELNEFVNKSLEGENKRLRRQNRLLKFGIIAVPVVMLGLLSVK